MDTLVIVLFNLIIGVPALLGFGDRPETKTLKATEIERAVEEKRGDSSVQPDGAR